MSYSAEIKEKKRFAFGKNWKAFLGRNSEERITEAEKSLREMLRSERLDGGRFLDVGSGSGLFSLAAWRMGAAVRSFDYDRQSVECAVQLREGVSNPENWVVTEGSVLDRDFMISLGRFDVVYSWGVLHHTGAMWQALENVTLPVAPGGRLFIAIYNDQGGLSRMWLRVKKAYCGNWLGRSMVKAVFIPCFFFQALAVSLIRHGSPVAYFVEYKKRRGMSVYHNWIDWLGGLPFEVAKPGEICDFYFERGFSLEKLVTTNRLGCNQFVFRKL